ncbi:jg22871 [Pararge aegeria aegeria]|uniref:Jg22871 protein n=1 Tax=Pararge aegeria aegeria TaxID=348720 RepID=A0A8S4R0K9_9NEOP|nr:jg22871 [Pararge aegeria aegeria]
MEALPEHSTDTSLIVPKEEILDDLEITFEKEYQDDKYYIIPKEEVCKSSLHLNGEDSSGFNHTPIKTELTLSDDVVQLRRDFNENTETENELVSTHKTVTKIKVSITGNENKAYLLCSAKSRRICTT